MSYSFELELPGSDSASDSGSEDEEEDGRFYKGMVPMADMLNADAGRNNVRHPLPLSLSAHKAPD